VVPALVTAMRRRDFITGIAGVAAAWSLAARAQQSLRPPIIGFLSSRSAIESAPVVAAFLDGLKDTGFIEGKNASIIYQWADGKLDLLPILAEKLIEDHATVFFAAGGDIVAQAARKAAPNTPIVFLTGTDPAKTGLVASLSRPGDNITGVTLYSRAVQQKRLELLRELVPSATTFGALLNPNNPSNFAARDDIESADKSLGTHTEILFAGTTSEFEDAFDKADRMKVKALLVGTDSLFSAERDKIIELARRHSLPASYDSRIQVAAGGLMSYGASYTDTYHQAGRYVGQVLNGASPANLPVLLPTKFELVINLKAAKVLRLSVPPSLLATADEVIE
jgi:putative tryptophan/tyrosine transport system substrate-binding protein